MTALDGAIVLERIFEPARIGGMQLKNRLVMPPMVTNYATDDGSLTDRQKDYYEARARGGVGLIIVEAALVDRAGKGLKNQLGLYDDRFIPRIAELAEAVKRHGARIAIQLHHAGLSTRREYAGRGPVGPSNVTMPLREMPRQLSAEEIQRLVQQYAKAAHRAQQAGFDGVEIHGAHGYLLANFFSSYLNRRDDAYGGSVENRARFLVETIKATKLLVGNEFPVWCRINGGEVGPQAGVTAEDAQALARLVEEAGAAAISVSAFSFGVNARSKPPMAMQPGYLLPFAQTVKGAAKIPVIAVGAFDPPSAEAALVAGKADLVAIGRGLLADPDLPNKAAAGRLSEIRPCIKCNCCLDMVGIPALPVSCTVNGTLGKERSCEIGKETTAKRVFVAGGGPAGMEAARVAALRGHKVTLFEGEAELGGNMAPGSQPPHKASIKKLVEYQSRQLTAVGVDISFGAALDVAAVQAAKPDAVIVATGGTPITPAIRGIDRANVVKAIDVLRGRVDVGQRVVFIGAELVGCETAEMLADRGKTVILLRRGHELATNVNASARDHLLARLAYKRVEAITGVRYEEITDQGVVITTPDGERLEIPADTVVIAAGARPNTDLVEALRGQAGEVIIVGDAVQPRNIMSAIDDGYQAGLRV